MRSLLKSMAMMSGMAAVVVAFGLMAWSSAAPAGNQGHSSDHKSYHYKLGHKPGRAAEHKNMQLVGHNDLQARSTYQPIVQEQDINGWPHYIAYLGHHNGEALNPMTGVVEQNGVSIVDVTNPRHPVYLHHLPATDGNSGSQMVRACSGDELPGGEPGHTYLLRTNGNDGHQVYDVTDPTAPVLVSTPSSGLTGTHKNYWECSTGIAYLVSGVPGWHASNRMTQVFDLSDPANPVHIRDFGLPGQEPTSTEDPAPQGVHGCISVPDKNRVYCGHGTSSRGIVVILDRDKLLNGCDTSFNPDASASCEYNPTPEDLQYPIISQTPTPDFMGAHTTFPVFGIHVPSLAGDNNGRFPDPVTGEPGPDRALRDFLVVVNEAGGNQCAGALRQMVYMMDITDEVHPWSVANFHVPEFPGDFCNRGGRFGSHSSNENFTSVFYKKLVFVSYFNAGVRAIDIRDPFDPKEAGYYIPATNANTIENCGNVVRHGQTVNECKAAIQTNNVDVDDRGFIYIVDRADTGLDILKLTGSARQIANLPH